MGMSISTGGGPGEDEEPLSAINTTPLVDVMLVLLIIFLITVPVITQSVKVDLPKAANIPTQTKPENIVIAVNRDGELYWGIERLPDAETLVERLKKEGFTILLVEQNFRFAATVADRPYVMEHGRVVDMIPNAELASSMAKLHDYLGV